MRKLRSEWLQRRAQSGPHQTGSPGGHPSAATLPLPGAFQARGPAPELSCRGWRGGELPGTPAHGTPSLFSWQETLFVLLQYLPPGVIALVNFLGPLLFVFLVQLESYPPNTEVNLILIW